MENKNELLKKLGFSDELLKIIADETKQIENEFKAVGQYAFDVITVDSSEIIYPIIEKTEEPVNSYVN